MPDASPWYVRFKERLVRFWRTDNPRLAILRDVIGAGLIVGLLLATIWIYAGQPLSQAPVVSVESGSMMHGPYLGGQSHRLTEWGSPPFGRIGTIDPGDIVFVKRVRSAASIEPAFGAGGRSGYGGHGDVIVFRPNGASSVTRVIHRAMLYVEASPEGCKPNVDCVFRIPAACDNPGFTEWAGGNDLSRYCQGSPDLITLNLRRGGLFLDLANFPCTGGAPSCTMFRSGFVTKGDNNAEADQSSGISGPVELSWIIGKARGEIPWFGLIKLALYGNPTYGTETDPSKGANWRILRASAPWDVWLCLLISLGVLVAIPVLIDYASGRRGARPPV